MMSEMSDMRSIIWASYVGGCAVITIVLLWLHDWTHREKTRK
jgi:hypothetical protein